MSRIDFFECILSEEYGGEMKRGSEEMTEGCGTWLARLVRTTTLGVVLPSSIKILVSIQLIIDELAPTIPLSLRCHVFEDTNTGSEQLALAPRSGAKPSDMAISHVPM